jgi:ABC-type enterochelin transport system permease subunit
MPGGLTLKRIPSFQDPDDSKNIWPFDSPVHSFQALTVLCIDLARVLFPGEIPLGILTSLIGTAIFMALMMHQSRAVQA